MTNFDKYLSNQPLAEHNIYSSIRSKHGFQSDVDARLHTEYEGEMYMRNRSALLRRILLAGILLGLILAGFCVYLRTTRNMTVERNANYVADAAAQTAKRIDDLLVGAENSINAIARMYPRFSSDFLQSCCSPPHN